MVVYILILESGSKTKKATINSKDTDDKCFQYATLMKKYVKIKIFVEL